MVRPLGQGAMGSVYLMRQTSLDRLVAVKVVRDDALTPALNQRLLREAQVLARLGHPNVIQIHESGIDETLPYMVCEYVDGETLAARLRRPPRLSVGRCLRIAAKLLRGLGAAHRQGVIHRDVKPANVFLTGSAGVKIGDFGLAKAHSLTSGTVAGRIMGTPPYMSPEQCRGHSTSPASDLYSAGIVLFEMLTGSRPFPGPELHEYLAQHLTVAPPRVRSLRPDLVEDLDRILERALQKDPDLRYPSASEFRTALVETARSIAASGESAPVRRRGTPRHPAPRAGLVLDERYALVRMLGQGGMGQVWLAADLEMDRTEVAIKLLPPELWRDAEARAAVKQEARLSQRLAHPSIVRLINLEPGEPPFLVMEYVPGATLADELAGRKEHGRPPLTAREAAPLLDSLAAALDHAHAKNVVHRDVKPSNVLLDARTPDAPLARLADFGIAAELTSFRTRQTGMVPAGTLAYMSPEQQACQRLDGRSDVYSLAATLYQMLTLSPPFSGGNLAWAIANAPVPVPEAVAGPVTAVVLGALAKTREERPASAGELARAFRRAVDSSESAARSARAVPGAADAPAAGDPRERAPVPEWPPPTVPLPVPRPAAPGAAGLLRARRIARVVADRFATVTRALTGSAPATPWLPGDRAGFFRAWMLVALSLAASLLILQALRVGEHGRSSQAMLRSYWAVLGAALAMGIVSRCGSAWTAVAAEDRGPRPTVTLRLQWPGRPVVSRRVFALLAVVCWAALVGMVVRAPDLERSLGEENLLLLAAVVGIAIPAVTLGLNPAPPIRTGAWVYWALVLAAWTLGPGAIFTRAIDRASWSRFLLCFAIASQGPCLLTLALHPVVPERPRLRVYWTVIGVAWALFLVGRFTAARQSPGNETAALLVAAAGLVALLATLLLCRVVMASPTAPGGTLGLAAVLTATMSLFVGDTFRALWYENAAYTEVVQTVAMVCGVAGLADGRDRVRSVAGALAVVVAVAVTVAAGARSAPL
jgi:serine/threonine protein kinase